MTNITDKQILFVTRYIKRFNLETLRKLIKEINAKNNLLFQFEYHKMKDVSNYINIDEIRNIFKAAYNKEFNPYDHYFNYHNGQLISKSRPQYKELLADNFDTIAYACLKTEDELSRDFANLNLIIAAAKAMKEDDNS